MFKHNLFISSSPSTSRRRGGVGNTPIRVGKGAGPISRARPRPALQQVEYPQKDVYDIQEDTEIIRSPGFRCLFHLNSPGGFVVPRPVFICEYLARYRCMQYDGTVLVSYTRPDPETISGFPSVIAATGGSRGWLPRSPPALSNCR